MSNGHVPPPLGNKASSSSGSSSGRKSCFLIGCISLATLILIGVVLIGVGVGFLVKKSKTYTAASPVELREYETKQGECETLQARFDAFDKDGGTLTLSAADLNAVIACNPDWEILKDRAWVQIEDDLLVVDGSFPLSMIPGLRSRYFNGTVSLSIHKEADELRVFVTGIDIAGKTIPAAFIEKISDQNLAGELKDNAQLDSFLKKLESIKIKNGQLILTK